MKHHKRYLALLALATMAQVSCLKDNANNASPLAGTNNVVEFQNTSVPVSYTSIWPQYDNTITLTGDTGSFPINLNYAGAQSVAPTNINVTLALDTGALSAFNADQGTNYILPPDAYTLPTSVTIPKGVNTVQIHANITAGAGWDWSQTYALPLKIISSSYGVISSNFGTAIYTFVANNKFGGNYATTGFVFHPSSPRALNATYAVGTTGLYSNKFPVGDLGGNNYYFIVTSPTSGSGAVTGYQAVGSTPAAPSSGFMTADNPGGVNYSSAAPNAPGQGAWVSSTYNNTYDATKQTYWLHIGYGGGSANQNGYTRQFYMKMVKQ